MLTVPLLLWTAIVRPQLPFLFATYVLGFSLILLARTPIELVGVLFTYFGIDGYLRLLFGYNWAIYVLPFLLLGLTYLRWFMGADMRPYRRVDSLGPIAIPLVGIVALFGLEMFNGQPWDPAVSAGGFAYHVALVPLLVIGANGFRTRTQVRQLLWFIVLLCIFESAYAVIQFHFGPPSSGELFAARARTEAWWDPQKPVLIYRPTGLTLSGIGPGIYGLVGAVVALGLFVDWARGAMRLAVGFAMVLLLLLALLLSVVRAFWVGLLVALLVFAMFQRPRLLLMIPLVGLLAGLIVGEWTHGAAYSRLGTLANPWQAFVQNRGGDIAALPGIVRAHPFGIGIGRVAGSAAGQAKQLFADEQYGGAHNYWVGITWESSVLAPILMGWLVFGLLVQGVKRLRTSAIDTRPILVSIIAFDAAVVSTTLAGPLLAGGASSLAQYFWFLSGLLLSVSVWSSSPVPTTPDYAKPTVKNTQP